MCAAALQVRGTNETFVQFLCDKALLFGLIIIRVQVAHSLIERLSYCIENIRKEALAKIGKRRTKPLIYVRTHTCIDRYRRTNEAIDLLKKSQKRYRLFILLYIVLTVST